MKRLGDQKSLRFKMYKKGRQWLTGAITIAGAVLIGMATTTVSADDSSSASVNTSVQSSSSLSSSTSGSQLTSSSADNSTDISTVDSTKTENNSATSNDSSEDVDNVSSDSQAVTSASSSANQDSSSTASSDNESTTDQKNQDDFTQDNYVAMGDSITQGWNGKTNVNQPYPGQVGNILAMNSVDGSTYAIGGAAMDGTANRDFPQRVDALLNDPKLATYDVISIAYGINDLNYGNHSLVDIQQTMITQISRIIIANNNIKIYGILPISSYKWGGTDNLGPAGFSENDLLDAEAEVYASFGIPYLDWREDPIVTDTNYSEAFADDPVNYTHPTQETYNKIANRIAKFFEGNLPSSISIHQSELAPTPKFTRA